MAFWGVYNLHAIHPDSLKTSKELNLGKEVKAWLTGEKATYALNPKGDKETIRFLYFFFLRTAKEIKIIML